NWTAVGAAISAIVVDYSLDNGTNWYNIVTNAVASAGGTTVTNSVGVNNYAWTPPATAFSNAAALVRVSDPDNYTLARGQSAAPFTLTSKTVVTNPAGANDSWSANSTQGLTWTSVGTFANAKLIYDAEGNFDGTNEVDLTADAYDGGVGGTGNEYVGATTPNDGNYAWVIIATTPLGPTAKLKIVDADHAYGLAIVSDNFETKGSITVSAPTGAVELTAGVAAAISWQRFGNIAAVHVQYSDDDGATYYSSCASPGAAGNAIACTWNTWTGNDGTLNWAPPQNILSKLSETAGQGYKIRVLDTANSTVYGLTPEVTVEGQLAITGPVSDPGWKIGQAPVITWNLTQGNTQNVRILGSRSGNFSGSTIDQPGDDMFTITASTDADNVAAFNAGNTPRGQGSYTWTIADTYAVGSILSTQVPGDLKLRVLDVASCAPPANELCFDTIAESVALSLTGQIAVTTPPAAGAPGAWRVGDTDKFVTWTAQGQLGLVKIELDPDGAGPAGFTEITNPASRPNASAGSWPVSSWTPGGAIADFKTDQALLRITRASGGTGTLVSGSSTAFAIYPKITNVTAIPAAQDAGSSPPIWRAGVQSP
ncbi:MAG: hypothetical protein ACREMG_06270, partial [Gemmatimonadales bacterium]